MLDFCAEHQHRRRGRGHLRRPDQRGLRARPRLRRPLPVRHRHRHPRLTPALWAPTGTNLGRRLPLQRRPGSASTRVRVIPPMSGSDGAGFAPDSGLEPDSTPTWFANRSGPHSHCGGRSILEHPGPGWDVRCVVHPHQGMRGWGRDDAAQAARRQRLHLPHPAGGRRGRSPLPGEQLSDYYTASGNPCGRRVGT